MKLELAKYECKGCAAEFEAPSLAENAYGEFLLRSKHGVMAYLNAFLDTTYKEVDNILSFVAGTANLPPLARAKVLRSIYGGLACDFDENNSPFEIDAYPPCPVCGGQEIVSWEFRNRPHVLEMSVPSVTHNRWNMLSTAEKIELTNSRLQSRVERA
jgi:hypothetical protein